jgi:hypothetical protein
MTRKRYYYHAPSSTLEIAGKVYHHGDEIVGLSPEDAHKHRFRLRVVEEDDKGKAKAEEE